MRPPFETFKGPICRGSYALGSACGRCEKCRWERDQITAAVTEGSKVVKNRVLIAINEGGDWRAFGHSFDGGGQAEDDRIMDDAWEWAEGIARMVWIEFELPAALPIPVVAGNPVPRRLAR